MAKIPFEKGAWYRDKKTGEYCVYEWSAIEHQFVHHWFRFFNTHLDGNGEPKNNDCPASYTFDREIEDVEREDPPEGDAYIKPDLRPRDCISCGRPLEDSVE